jgi:hypothetical protein
MTNWICLRDFPVRSATVAAARAAESETRLPPGTDEGAEVAQAGVQFFGCE